MNRRTKIFLAYYKPYLGLLGADLACALLVSASALALPLCARAAIQSIGAPGAPGRIAALGALMAALILIHCIANTFVDYRGHMMGTLIERDMRRDLFAHLQKLPFRFYDQRKTGQLMTRLTSDLESISELCHHGPEDLAIGLVNFIGVFGILLLINPPLALIIFAFFPPMAAYAMYFNRKMNRAMLASKERIGEINAQAEDTLAGIRVVQSFANEALEAGKFAAANERFVESRRAGYRSEAFFYQGMVAFTQLMTAMVVVVGALAAARGGMGAADLTAALLYVGLLIEPIQRFVNFGRLYQEGVTGFERMMDLIDIEPAIRDRPGAAPLAHVRGGLRFREVSFSYGEERDRVLRDLSFAIRPGEYVALVGPSGAGKTTLCSLIPRFYEPEAGAIELDGRDIREISLRALRENIGVVQQDVYLFAGSVADNIRYGKPGATLDEVIAAARRANAHGFISALPQGYDTDIGQRGVKLSGGQKQRLSIARVFLKDPPILIFDEATSALDNESERAIQESLELLAERRTTIVIAHRLSTIRKAGRILVLSNRGIAEQGTHDELMEGDGIYASLYNASLSV
ncbi:MAG TPA: ABC transporter ATP-binding protein [Herpetosiphonaceae bacterium]